MITQKNYYANIDAIPTSIFTAELQETKQLIDEATQFGKSWELINSDPDLSEVFELYLTALNQEYNGEQKKVESKKTVKSKAPRVTKRASVRKTSTSSSTQRAHIDTSNAQKVERVDLELKFIRRYVNMNHKDKTANQIRLFLNALQKAIIEKRIRKTSKYAKEIKEIQSNLLDLFENLRMNGTSKVIIKESKANHYLKIIGKQVELRSVKFIKSYVRLQGRLIDNLKAKNLYNRIIRAFNTSKLTKRDRYWDEIELILNSLKSFVKKNKKDGVLSANEKALNGLNGILEDCKCDSLSGVANPVIPKGKILRTTDIVNLNFDSIGFKGKWLELIGDPTAGFSTMIFGKPKMGKSYLAVDLAQYLARNHGTVLYVAAEEQITATFKQKLTDMKGGHPDFYATGELPEDLSKFDFVFIDSVNNHGLSVEDINDLEEANPKTSFIYIFQTTKHGVFRGSNEFQHNVDVVIEVPEKGKAIQFGRFNQGGEIEIFNSNNVA